MAFKASSDQTRRRMAQRGLGSRSSASEPHKPAPQCPAAGPVCPDKPGPGGLVHRNPQSLPAQLAGASRPGRQASGFRLRPVRRAHGKQASPDRSPGLRQSESRKTISPYKEKC